MEPWVGILVHLCPLSHPMTYCSWTWTCVKQTAGNLHDQTTGQDTHVSITKHPRNDIVNRWINMMQMFVYHHFCRVQDSFCVCVFVYCFWVLYLKQFCFTQTHGSPSCKSYVSGLGHVVAPVSHKIPFSPVPGTTHLPSKRRIGLLISGDWSHETSPSTAEGRKTAFLSKL